MGNLALVDWVVLLIYVAVIIRIGIYAGREEKNTDDYFLGGRQMPWWAVMISIYATSLSALTFIGVPGAAYKGDFHYLQLGLGEIFGKTLICLFFLTAYYRERVTTVYEFLGKRFGPRSHDAGTLFFIVTRLLASGVRLACCAIALSVVFALPLNTAIIVIAIIALVYTFLGGIKAVIWTDMIQFFLFLIAATISLGTIFYHLPGGFSEFWQIGEAHNKFQILRFSTQAGHQDYWLDFSNPSMLLAGFVFGCLSTFAALGTDQDLVQRMLTCKKVGESQRALILTAFLNFPVTLLFLSVGAALFAYYHVFPDPAVAAYEAQEKMDYIFPHFIHTVLAPGVRGILIAGLLAAAMSSLDSALNALASTAYVDIYRRYINPHADDQKAVKVSRWLVMLFCAILAVIAMHFSHTESILWLGFRIVGYTYGALLGIFLLAVLSERRGSDWGNLLAMFSSVLVVLFFTADSATIGPLQPLRTTLLSMVGLEKIAWPWAIAIGTAWTLGLSLCFKERERGENNL